VADFHYSFRESSIGDEILGYLAEHPKSRDTLEGIAQWWLLEREIIYQIDKIKEAIAELVAKGFVLEYQSADLKIHYGINRNKYNEIQAILKQRKIRCTEFGREQ
jgi:hypothetical protein